MTHRLLCLTVLLLPVFAWADGPADNIPENVRRIPKLGIEVPAERRAKLEAGLKELEGKLTALRQGQDAKAKALLPDVEVYFKAVHDALAYQEFFAANEIDFADRALATGMERASQLAAGQAPWTTAKGLIVRGYVSKIDGSVQPYGLVLPESYSNQGPGKFRCDLWFHGRGETLSELNFIRDRTNNRGTFTPDDTIVLHPYGRYSNAFKFAGEIDVLEALESVQGRYRVDEDRIAARGFSMGGAAAWQFAVHYPDRWFAANPGAGFSETPEFLRTFQQEKLSPTWWEQKLWQWYDCTGYAVNLRSLPTVAYSGELDNQKQAADIMEKAFAPYGPLTHIIGPGTRHAYEPFARQEVERRMTSLAQLGRQRDFGANGNRDPADEFNTFTLRYNRLQWLTIDGLAEHWRRSRVQATIRQSDPTRIPAQHVIFLVEDNVTDLTIDFPAGRSPFPSGVGARISMNRSRQSFDSPLTASDRSLHVVLHKVGDQWQLGRRPEGGLRKKHGLQGPIDDAFMDSFLFVRPTGQAWNEAAGKWAAAELQRAIEHWRRHFRGQARVKDDTAVTPEDIAGANLVLWGDPSSNAVLKPIAGKLPIQWTQQQIDVGGQKFSADKHALIAIYPNPLNANRYVVLNSSFTFRDYAYLNNARQVPMLPDWAIVDLTTPPNSVWPGKIAAANFFDEAWQLKAAP